MILNPQVGTQQQSDIAQIGFTQIYYAQRIDVNNQIIFKFGQKQHNINFDSPFKGMYECCLYVNQQQKIDNLQVQRYLVDIEREKIRIHKILCFVNQFKPQWIQHFGLYEIKKQYLFSGQIVDYIRSDKLILVHDIFPFTLQNLPPLRYKQKVLLALRIAQQIKKLHENNIIHTQIAPYTIGINETMDDVFLYGFGLSKGVSKLNVQQQSQKDQRFIAPELLIQNNLQETVKSDIWSLGEVFNYLFNQHQHFSILNPKLSDLIEQMKNKSENERPGLNIIEEVIEEIYLLNIITLQLLPINQI